MGQQDSKPTTPESSPSHLNITNNTNLPPSASNPKKTNIKLIQCEGLLKLQSLPFKNCIQIQSQNEILFLQNSDITLKYLLQGRLNTNKLFTIQDIQKLIESVSFTLAYLQQHGVIYKDIHAENIFYDNGIFKMMPNQLIQLNSYQKLRQNGDVYPSPQYIIALRCGQEEIIDDDIIQKSNVFVLGMVLLQVTTLLSSSECYDAQNYDILDSLINQRLTLVEDYYGERIAKIIGNMLDYDYTQRMNLKELSIWVNRQLNNKLIDNSMTQNHNNSQSIQMSKATQKVRQQNKPGLNSSLQKSKSKMIKNNSVYMQMKRQTYSSKDDKNKVYAKENQIRQQELIRNIPNDQNRPIARKHQYQVQHTTPNIKRQIYDRQAYLEVDHYKASNGNANGNGNSVNHRPVVKSNQIYQEKDHFTLNQERRSNNFADKTANQRQTATIRMNKDQPYRIHQEQSLNGGYNEAQNIDNSLHQKPVLKEINISNHYYPKVDDLFKQKRYQKEEVKGGINENGSLNRIKQQILKSRKLIEEFKRSEGLKY